MQLHDHVNRFVEKQTAVPKVTYEEMAAPLRALMDEHREYDGILTAFEDALRTFKEGGWRFSKEVSRVFRDFFRFVDEELVPHHQKEDKWLFPLLRERLLASGEHSPGLNPFTPVDVMEDDHVKIGQTSCLIFNLLGLAARLPDPRSAAIIYNHAWEQGRDFVERLKLHIFKEEEVLFPLTHRLIRPDEFAAMAARMIF